MNGTAEPGAQVSDDEKYRLIGKTVSDHEEAKRHLATLQAQGREMADALNAFSNVLTGNAEIVGMGASGVQIKNRNSSKTAKADYPTWEQLGGLIHEIDATKKRIADLEERRREMGI